MPETAPRELMVLVERAVRPLPASLKRKKRMRDELFGHLLAIQAEELARDDDSVAVWERTKARFGDPAALSDELQQSIGLSDRWRRLIERCVMQQYQETTVRYALRLVALQLAMSSIIFCLSPVRLGVAILVFMAVGFGGLIYCGLSWAQEWNRRRLGIKWVLCTCGLVASFPAALVLMQIIAGWAVDEVTLSWRILAGWSLFAVICGPMLGVLHARDVAYLHEWADLELDVT